MAVNNELEKDVIYVEETNATESNNKEQNKAVAWFLSMLIHLLIIMSLCYILIPTKQKPDDLPIVTSTILEEETEEEEVKEIEIVKEKIEIQDVTIVEEPVVNEEVIENEVLTENEMEANSAEGVSEAISDLPLVGTGLIGNIGGGGGGGGAIGNRSGASKKKALMRNGGSKKTESAVELGLWWLATHQEPDGHWDLDKYEGKNNKHTTAACTGAALLAFLGAGHTDKVGKYKNNVKTAIDWLIKHQNPDGSFSKDNYGNGICVMALSEALGMGSRAAYEHEEAIKLAVDFLIKQQNASGAYNYNRSDKRDDMSVTGWCVMGLKSAMLAGIKEKEIQEVFNGVVKNFDSWDKTTGDNTSTTKGKSWYINNGGQLPGTACGAIAMLVRFYTGWKRTEPWLKAATDGHMQNIPTEYAKMNVYRVYYTFLSLFQQGGDAWTDWNKKVSPLVIESQRQDGDFKGSWDPNGVSHMEDGGRVLFTAFLVMSLEVYYRYHSVTTH